MPPYHLPENVRQMRDQMRRRPGMWVGGTDRRALHHMLWAAMDHMVEEAIEGQCNDIRLELRGNSAVVSNNGPGLPATGACNLTDIMLGTEMRPAVAGHYYGVQGGLHGLSLCILNHLSAQCDVETRLPDGVWQQSFIEGVPAAPLQRTRDLRAREQTGMSITFTPDGTVFNDPAFDFAMIAARCRDLAYLVPGATLIVDDQCGQRHCESFHTAGGLVDWVWQHAPSSETVFSSRQWATPTDDDLGDYTVMVDVAFQFGQGDASIERSFINTVETRDGGTHLNGLRGGILKELRTLGIQGKTWERVRMGFVGAVHVLHPQPLFEGRTRMRIRNTDIIPVVKQAVHDAFAAQPNAHNAIK